VSGLERFVESFFNPKLMLRYWPDIAQGMLVTVEIAFAVLAAGLALGLGLALLRSYRIAPVSAAIVVFVDVFRALPPLVLILIAYFGLPGVGLNLSAFAVLWLVLSLVLAAFAEEAVWAGILSVRRGQWDAARSTGLSFGQALVHVVLPQAVRLAVPPLTNRTIAITKNTALGTVIGVGEVINQAQTAVSFSGNATPLMMAALGYLAIFAPVVALGTFVEKRFAWRRA
jgi:polar amino acid transport system permease protein